MRLFKKFISFSFLFAFLGGIYLVSQLILKNVIPSLSGKLVLNSLVAFFGAFFAFSFVKIGEFFNKKRKRNVEHYNAVIKFQHIFNKSINSLRQNRTFLNNNVKALEGKKILVLSFYELPIHDELVHDLKNIDFMNEVYAIFRDYEAINLDLQSLTSFYNEVKNFFFESKISVDDFKSNVADCIGRMIKLSNYLEQTRIKSIRLFAMSKILAREDKRWNFFFGPHVKKHYAKNIEKMLQVEIAIVDEEIRSMDGFVENGL